MGLQSWLKDKSLFSHEDIIQLKLKNQCKMAQSTNLYFSYIVQSTQQNFLISLRPLFKNFLIIMISHICFDFQVISCMKSVQSNLSHLQSPPEQMQSQRNYGSYRPVGKRQCLIRAICYFQIISIKQGETTVRFLTSRGKCSY